MGRTQRVTKDMGYGRLRERGPDSLGTMGAADRIKTEERCAAPM